MARMLLGSLADGRYFRSRMIRRDPAPGYWFGPNRERLTSSLHNIINSRVGLFPDRDPVEARPGDVLPPYRYDPARPRRSDQDPRRLP